MQRKIIPNNITYFFLTYMFIDVMKANSRNYNVFISIFLKSIYCIILEILINKINTLTVRWFLHTKKVF